MLKNIKNPFSSDSPSVEDWGKVKFVPKVSKVEKLVYNSPTPWKKFKNELIEKQREEETSNTVDTNSPEAQEILKKREQNHRRMLITEQSKQTTQWESFEYDVPTSSSSSSSKKEYKKSKKNFKNSKICKNPTNLNANLFKGVELDNFDAKKLKFKQNDTVRKILTKTIMANNAPLYKTVRDMKKKAQKNKS